MSTRQIPKIILGAVALLLLATGGFILSRQGRQTSNLAQIRLTQDQPQLIEELSQDVARLSAATTLVDVNQDRYRLGSAVVRFDQALSALLHGGYLENDSGERQQVARVEPAETRNLLDNAARIWLETGVPLADLAAGEFSIFSSAGQEAIRSLETNKAELASLFQQIKVSLEQDRVQQQATLAYARWSAAGLGAVMLALGFLIWRAGRPRSQARAAENTPAAPTCDMREGDAPHPAADLRHSRPSVVPVAQPYASPVDFGNLNASVDQISVDLGTIANSTEKMRQAIESVGHGMQGLLYSLKETASSTAEDARILHNANNAAGFTAESSAELATSAREMSKVVNRVSQLALRTKQIAGGLETDSIQLDPESDTHTSVVAAEILQLARQTSQATEEIELTVSTILTTARLYDEAIGQIIKNVSKINQISQNLGGMIKAGPPILAAPPRAHQAPLAVQRPLASAAPVEATAPTPPPPSPTFDYEPEAADAGPSITDELSAALSAIKDVQAAAPELNRPSDPDDDHADSEGETAGQSGGNVFIFDTSQLSADEDYADEEANAAAPNSGTRVFIEQENEETDLTGSETASTLDEPRLDEPQLDEPQLDEPQLDEPPQSVGADEKEGDHADQENPNVYILP